MRVASVLRSAEVQLVKLRCVFLNLNRNESPCSTLRFDCMQTILRFKNAYQEKLFGRGSLRRAGTPLLCGVSSSCLVLIAQCEPPPKAKL
jgi:hypothetical protein